MSKTSYAVVLGLLVASVGRGEVVFVDFGNGAVSANYTSIGTNTALVQNLLDEVGSGTGITITRISGSDIGAHDSFASGAGTGFTDEATNDGLFGDNPVTYEISGLPSDFYELTLFAAVGQRTTFVDTVVTVTGDSGGLSQTLMLDDIELASSSQDSVTFSNVGVGVNAGNSPTITVALAAEDAGGQFHISAMRLEGSAAAAVPECSSFLCLGLSVLAIAGWRRYGACGNC